MEINEYIEKKKKMQELLLTYLENENNVEENYQNFIDYCNIEEIGKNKFDLEILLLQLFYISNDHHRFPSFMSKIETILNNFKNEIKQSFSIKWIVKKFQKNKRLLLYFLKSKIIESNIDFYNNLREFLSGIGEVRREEYYAYFFTELKPIFKAEFSKKIEGRIKDSPEIYEQKRELGENDNYICELIRNDSINEFIEYVKKGNVSLTMRIKPSIFETHYYLNRFQNQTLIEYACFFWFD